MKIIKLHSKSTSIVYKNSLCSLTSLAVFLITVATVVVPILLVTWLSPYSGVSENKILFEQPDIRFQYKFFFIGHTEDEGMIACSTFPYFNKITSEYQRCKSVKYWEEDLNYDQRLDKVNFELNIDTDSETNLKSFHLVLFFEAVLQHKCILKPPALIIFQIEIPKSGLPHGEITINSRLKLIQNTEFICPYYGRKIKSHFYNEILHTNTSRADSFDIEHLRKMYRANVAYFEAQIVDTYFRRRSRDGVKINVGLEIFEVSSRYRLSIWERLGQFWLYYVSFFLVILFVTNKIKDFLFSRHILRSWEIIPWKKLY